MSAPGLVAPAPTGQQPAGARTGAAGTIDVAFAVQGGPLDRDYAAALHAQLRVLLPWFDDEPRAGVHPLRGTTAVDGRVQVGPRTRLVLRVPAARIDACLALAGRTLALREPLHVGAGRLRPLLPYRTVYSPLVITGDATEDRFLAAVQRVLATWDAACEVIVGRAGARRIDAAGTEALAGFSVMLHGTSPALSLRAQEDGIGGYRKFGCGVFVPHRSADAVGT
jgi:CRISPR-associated protein Cas6